MSTGSASAPACNTTDTESARNASSGNTGASFVTWESSAVASAWVRWIGCPLTGPVESPEQAPSSAATPTTPQTRDALTVTSSGLGSDARIGADSRGEEDIRSPGGGFRKPGGSG